MKISGEESCLINQQTTDQQLPGLVIKLNFSANEMAKKKEKDPTAPTLEEKIKRLETRLREFEERSGKKIKDLENLVEYLTNKVMK